MTGDPINYNALRLLLSSDSDPANGITKLYRDVNPYASADELMSVIGSIVWFAGPVPAQYSLDVMRTIRTLLGCVRCEFSDIPKEQ